MCDRSQFDRAKCAIDSTGSADNVGDENVGLYLAKQFCALYSPGPPPNYEAAAAKAIEDTLAKGIPGCLTKDQVLDDDIQALIFVATAAKHGWVKR